METAEIWKNIVGYEKYQISNKGNIKNKDGKILKYQYVSKKNNPRPIVWLRNNQNKKNNVYIAVLVYKHFINPNLNTRTNVIKYKDNNAQNCDMSNLYLVSRKDYFNEKEILKTRNKNIYNYKGELLDLNEISNKTKMPKKTLISRLRWNWTVEEATEIPIKRSEHILHKTLYKYQNNLLSAKQISQKYKIKVNTFYKRLRLGWTVEEAIEIPVAKRK